MMLRFATCLVSLTIISGLSRAQNTEAAKASSIQNAAKDFRFILSPTNKYLGTNSNSLANSNSLELRPNVSNSIFLLVKNTSKSNLINFAFGLTADRESKKLIASSSLLSLPADTVKFIPLKVVSKSAPPSTATDKSADAKSATGNDPIASRDSIPLPSKLYLVLNDKNFSETDRGEIVGDDISVMISAPQGTKKLVNKWNDSASTTDLTFTMTMNDLVTDKYYAKDAVKIRLNLRPDLNPSIAPLTFDESSLETELPFEKDAQATLFVKGLKRKTNDSIKVAIDIDGFHRSAMYTVGKSDSVDNPDAQSLFVRSDESMMVPGKPFRVFFEPYLQSEDKKWELKKKTPSVSSNVQLVKTSTKLFDQSVSISSNDDGSLALATTHQDWAVLIPSTGFAGKFEFHATIDNLKSNTASVVIDPSKPDGVKLEVSTGPLYIGETVNLKAKGSDSLSGISKVWFYRGDPPMADGKAAPGSIVIPGILKSEGQYESERPLLLPDLKGETRIGVVVINKVGLAASDEKVVFVQLPKVVEKPVAPPKKLTGTLTGTVMKGYLAQNEIPVTLLDSTGKTVVKTAKTNAQGQFKFEDLQPGSYVVSSEKKGDASGQANVTIEADREAKVELLIRR